jgi:hypothetical protein
MLGSANFRNRYPEIAARVRRLCDTYDLPYTTGSLGRQYLLAFRTIHKLALPDRFLCHTGDDAPETSSEQKFAGLTRVALPTADHWARHWVATTSARSAAAAPHLIFNAPWPQHPDRPFSPRYSKMRDRVYRCPPRP